MEEIINVIIDDFTNPTPLFVIAQILGLGALICTVVSMQLKKKRPLMILQTLSELFIVCQYFILGAWAGGLISCVSFFRDLILTKFYEKKRAPFWFLMVLYLAIAATASYSLFAKGEGAIALLPAAGSLIYATSLWYGKTKYIRLGNAIGNTPYIIYTAISKSYVVMIMTIIEVISAAVGFLRIDVFKKKSTKKSKSRKK